MSKQLSGCYVLLVTPLQENGELDEASTRRLVDRMIEQGVNGVIGLGSVGEFYALTIDERKRFMRWVTEQVAGRVPVGFGTSDAGTAIMCQLTQYAASLGADFALVLPPLYGHITAGMTYNHLRQAADSTRIEVMLYDGGGGIEIPLDVMVRLLRECANVNSAKFSMPSADKVASVLEMTDGACTCFIGVPAQTMMMLANGATAMSSGMTNVLPTEMVNLMRSALNGDMDTARSIFAHELTPLSTFISAPALKLMLAWEGVIASPAVRGPLRPLGKIGRAELEATARLVGLRLPHLEHA